jgi:hypothetical protein
MRDSSNASTIATYDISPNFNATGMLIAYRTAQL